MTQWGLPVEDRLAMRLVERDSGCLEWTGARRNGYGNIRLPGNGPATPTHRLAWELANGPIPEGMVVCHHCDNPPCCNVDHLFLGTQKDNADDREAKGRGNHRTRSTCKAGLHDLAVDGYTNPTTGRRRCRPCGTRHKREWKARNLA